MEELINKAQNGDIEAYTQIILSVKDDLYKIAKTRISNETDVEDAIQETMIEVFKSIKKLKEPKKLKKWLIKILINKCNKIYRRKYKNDISIDEYDINNYIITDEYKEIENEINFFSLLKNLKYEEKIILTLYYMEEYSVKEIRKIIGMNENTINTHLYRAKQKIKNNYKGGIINE